MDWRRAIQILVHCCNTVFLQCANVQCNPYLNTTHSGRMLTCLYVSNLIVYSYSSSSWCVLFFTSKGVSCITHHHTSLTVSMFFRQIFPGFYARALLSRFRFRRVNSILYSSWMFSMPVRGKHYKSNSFTFTPS